MQLKLKIFAVISVDAKSMTPEWLLTLITDPQGFWKLLQYYFTAPFTVKHVDIVFFAVALFLFLLLLCVCLLASGTAIASETRREKKEREKRQLKHYQERCEREAPDV